jgi:hypothetical protein
MNSRNIFLCVGLTLLAACAGQKPQVSYPAFVQVDDIPDSFVAGLPGTRAKILSSNLDSRRSSLLLLIPPDWNFGTGGSPEKTLELFLLEGDLTLGEFNLEPGGYAFLPARSMGVKMSSRSGALLLYFLDDVQPDAVIQSPIINNSNLLDWQAISGNVEDFGISIKELRADPGSGARTWLKKIEPGAVQGWQQASAVQEGYMVSGHYQHNECGQGGIVPGEYSAGGYFMRPAGAINGGPNAIAVETTVWVMRVPSQVSYMQNLHCATDTQ